MKEEKITIKQAKLWEVLVAGGIGALIASIADMFKNQGGSGVAQLSKLINLGGDGVALVLLVVLGVGICWVFRPVTKLDGFARGLAILTIIGISSKNDLPDVGPNAIELEGVNLTQKVEPPLLASIAWVDVPHYAALAPCPEARGSFEPNATVVHNEWISSSKPETKFYSTNIYTTKCGSMLYEGQQIQIIGYYETNFSGYYYVHAKYKDSNNTLRAGWIYAGRSPNHFQSVKPINPKLTPYSFG